jgi:3-oxoacyl-[acyl-carrier protein] reductase
MKNILITGGTRGLGLEYARYLSANGYNIGLTDISKDACKVYGELDSIDDLLAEIKSLGVKVWFDEADLTIPESAEKIAANFIDYFGQIDGVITSAGGDISGSDKDAAGGKAENNSFFISFTEHENIFLRNYYTCLNTLRAVVPYMQNQKFGKIITVSSVNAAFGVERETAYSVAKSSVLQLTRSLAKELRKDGINVNCIMPGPTKTGRFLSTLKGRNQHDLEGLNSDARLDRIAVPSDIAPVVEFLLSDNSNFISGEVIKIDGGMFPQPV